MSPKDNKPYKLLISDVDGTLVDQRQKIPPVNKEAIRQLKQKGFQFSLATGRKFNSAHSFLRELEIDAPVILYNGAQIVDSRTGKVFYEKKLDAPTVKAALATYREFGLEALVYDQGEIFVEEINPTLEEYMRKDHVPVKPVGNLSESIKGEVTKLLFIGAAVNFLPFEKRLEDLLGNPANFVQSEATYLEILPPGASKGAALRVLATLCDLKPAEIIAIGDQYNDLAMLKAAGLGVAPRNAPLEIQKAADYVTERDHSSGAVAEVIYQFFPV